MNKIVASIKAAWIPSDTRTVSLGIAGTWFLGWLAYWSIAKPVLFPSPFDVIGALPDLWTRDGLGQELISSISVNVSGLLLSAAIALPLAYLSIVPAARPVAMGLSKLRFLSPAVFFLPLVFVAPDTHWVKIFMLTIGETFFLVTTMITVVDNIPHENFDDARTLRMSEWQTLWYVVVRGTLGDAFEAIRDNAAMGFAMLMMVEGIVRSEGGVGVMILDQQRYMNFAPLYAICGVVLAVGLTQDWLIGWARRTLLPWSVLEAR